MRKTAWRVILLAIGLPLIVFGNLRESKKRIDREPRLSELQVVFTTDVNPQPLEGPIHHYRGAIKQTGGEADAAGVLTARLPPRIKGYVDEINVLVAVDNTGTIQGARVIQSRETPSYMKKVIDAGFLEKLKGRRVAEGKKGVDAVTGASVTSRAILDDVLASAALAGNQVYGLDLPAPEIPGWGRAFADPRFLAVLSALVLALLSRFFFTGNKKLRGATRAAAIVLIGIYAMTPFTLVHVFGLFSLDLPGPGNPVVAALAVFSLLTTLAAGPVWCSHACPFGALQELLYRVPAEKLKVSPRLMNAARELRYLVLFSAVSAFFGLGLHEAAEIEPFGHLFGRTHSVLAWIFILAVLSFSVFIRRFWCRFFCPTGATLVLLSSHRRWLKSVRRGLDEAAIDRADENKDDEHEEHPAR